MNTPHTPAPWVRMGQGILNHPVTGTPVTLERIETSLGIIEVLDLTNESKGNLALIIAAPELLAALQELVAVCDLDEHRTTPVTHNTPLARWAIVTAREIIGRAIGA